MLCFLKPQVGFVGLMRAEVNGELILSETNLGNWKLLAEFQERVKRAIAQSGLPARFEDPARELPCEQYLSLCLFGLVNPVVDTLRGLCAASQLERVQAAVGGGPVSLGSFSEAQHLLEPEFLERVFGPLMREVTGPAPADPRLATRTWLAHDGSLWRALPRMAWALYGAGRKGRSHAVRLHLDLNILEDKPERARVTEGARCERAVWEEGWQEGDAFVADRFFGEDYRKLNRLSKHGVFVIRLREEAVIDVEEELPLSEADRQAGVTRQAWVRLGRRQRSVRLRVVWVQGAQEQLILVTNLSPEELPAELVGLLYRKRWQVELFFRWVKCILGCRHFLAESPRGVALQLYLALIAALLLQLYVGRRPTKRMMELIQFYFLGVASPEELSRGLQKELERLGAKPAA